MTRRLKFDINTLDFLRAGDNVEISGSVATFLEALGWTGGGLCIVTVSDKPFAGAQRIKRRQTLPGHLRMQLWAGEAGSFFMCTRWSKRLFGDKRVLYVESNR